MNKTVKKPIDNVVICASGKGTRLEPLTTNIPKYLVNPSNFNLLTIIVNYWKQYTDHIILIIEKKYNMITSFYLDLLDVQYTILNVDIDKEGTAYTLSNALKNDYDHKKILITWCDIFPNVEIPHSVFKIQLSLHMEITVDIILKTILLQKTHLEI
jgi:NDP-sugar pyrophosphorylase family protein